MLQYKLTLAWLLQDWVHQTVQDYYLQVDSRSCTLSENLTAQLAYNIKFQQNCPANTVVFFEDIVKIVRTVVTEAVVITARLMGLLVKLLGMLSPDPAAKALYKQSFINDWVWIKAQAKATSSSLSDTIFDMLMDSGPIGKNLMSFFLKTCNSVNTLYNWVLNVWCNFVETHMIRLMTSLKTAIGFIATGFSFLQDFADNMFQVFPLVVRLFQFMCKLTPTCVWAGSLASNICGQIWDIRLPASHVRVLLTAYSTQGYCRYKSSSNSKYGGQRYSSHCQGG